MRCIAEFLELLLLLLVSQAFTKGTTVASQQVQAAANGIRSPLTCKSGICGSEEEGHYGQRCGQGSHRGFPRGGTDKQVKTTLRASSLA